MPDWLRYPVELIDLALAAAALDPAAFERASANRAAALTVLALPFLAGASELLGQAYVLAARRVSRAQAAASLVTTGLVYVAGAVVWGAATYALLAAARPGPPPDAAILGVVAVSYAPRVLSLLTIAPYYGEFVNRALDAWMMTCVALGLWVVVDGALWAVLACAAAGWAVSLSTRRVAGLVLGPAARRLGVITARRRPHV
ncbi:hypothetical protein DDZ18_04870 [Marinicauda salina]|uniref:Yip1 domain-containing protein n=1 Tax=Marinicauda salina TaxID=2135793 RepID=A0A2U2BV85_9PROT|nr:hypothetical protein [Marinicauda salina]PWE17912.1 hypothetical protein DDZ18_04870 [Marinicauda salina]